MVLVKASCIEFFWLVVSLSLSGTKSSIFKSMVDSLVVLVVHVQSLDWETLTSTTD